MRSRNRRDWLVGTGLAIGSVTASALGATSNAPKLQRKLKVMVVGAHPDDPETGCGGTMARYADLGHDVVSLYLTRGEAGIRGKTHEQAATLRTAEARHACEILRARPLFAGQIDGNTEITSARYDDFRAILVPEKPDIVFAHWPVDTHRDHRAASLLVFDAWLREGRKFALYYFEVLTGAQSQCFRPTNYVDITATEARKRAACMVHATQNPARFYPRHEAMSLFRGTEFGCKHAEAFVHHEQSPTEILPT